MRKFSLPRFLVHIFAVSILTLSACTWSSFFPDDISPSIPISVAPSLSEVLSDQTVIFAVDSEIWQSANLHWTISSELQNPGSLSSSQDSTVVYRAPSSGEGTVTVSVSGNIQRVNGEASVTFFVRDDEKVLNPPKGKIVFTCFVNDNDDICTMNADGSNVQRLTDNSFTDFYGSPAPNGLFLVYSSQQPGGVFRGFRIGMDGRDNQMLNFGLGNVFAPEVSPNGDKIAFVAASTDGMDIWTTNLDGTNPVKLTNKNFNTDPTWSPDGTKLAFTFITIEEGVSSDVFSAESKTIVIQDLHTNLTRTLDIDVEQIGGRIDWSPDGDKIAFYAGSRNQRDVYVVYIDDLFVRRLTFGGDSLAPAFSPDGSWITFSSTRDGDLEIFIMDVDGNNVQQLTFNDYSDWQPRWGIVPVN